MKSKTKSELLKELDKARIEIKSLIEERYKAENYLNIAEVIILALDSKGKISMINLKGEKVLGYKKEELIGKNWFDKCLQKDNKGQVKNVFDQLMKGKIENVEYYENPVVDKNGKIKIIAWHNSLMYDDKGNISGTLSSGEDIAERKKVEEEQVKLLKELAAKNEELENIVYVTSHDLRTPLVNIQGFSNELLIGFEEIRKLIKKIKFDEKIKMELDSFLDDAMPLSFKYVINNVNKMDKLLKGLLKLSRLGRVELNSKRYNMNDIAKETINGMMFQIKEKGVKVEVKKLPDTLCDRTQMNLVFSNLIDNAMKYSAKDRTCIIRISGKMDNGTSTLCIEDNGIGVDTPHIEKIFEIFHRLEPNGEISGEGLGLTIVKRIIERMNGKIWVESEKDIGTKFFIELPGRT